MAPEAQLDPVITFAWNDYIINWRKGINTTLTFHKEGTPHTISLALYPSFATIVGFPENVSYKSINPTSTPTQGRVTYHSSSAPQSYANPARTIPTPTQSEFHSTATLVYSKSNASNSGQTLYSSSDGISKGTTAGIAIGCVAAGALIAALLVFLLMRKLGYSQPSIQEYSPEQKSPSSSKEEGATVSRANALPAVFTVAEKGIPQPLEDMAIISEISRLQTLIKSFAQSYYHISPVADTRIELAELGSIAMPKKDLAAMLADPKSRLSAIRYCLMWTITSRTTLESDVRTSLLPPEIIDCLNSMPAAEDISYTPMLASWRAMTHHLLAPTYLVSSASTTRALNQTNTQLALRTLDTILQPYTDASRDSYDRLSKLEEILKRGASFGWILFGQMAELRVEWMGEENVRPVLVQKTDERGQRFGQGRVLWEGEGLRWRGGGV